MPLVFETRVRARALHLPKLAEAERVERSRSFRIIVGFRPTKHATCEPLNWRIADHSKAMPQPGHPSASNRVQDPACFTLRDWSPTEDLHPTFPAYKAGAPLSVRDGHRWWAAQESHLDHSAKKGSLSR